MELKKLTPESARAMADGKGRNVYLVDSPEEYLEELLERYDLGERLAGVLQDMDNREVRNRKRSGKKLLARGRELPVFPYDYFAALENGDFVIILNDYFRESYDKLLKWKKGTSGDCPDVFYFANRETEIESCYREKYENEPLENLIVFRSGPHASSYVKGMDYADNARALFEHMLKEGYNHKYELVWIVKDPSEFSDVAQGNGNVSFVSFDWTASEKKEERDAYYRAVCLAKYIFMTDAYGFARNARKGQIRVQLWHGCGFKTRINFVRCEKRYEYTTVVSELYSKIHQDIYGLREDQVLVTGYAKADWLFHPIREMREKLPIPGASKHIFWLPTFRMASKGLGQLNEYDLKGQTGLPIADTFEKMEELDGLLEGVDAVLVIKPHPFQDSGGTERIHMKRIVWLENDMLVERDVQINQILGNADGLISDYSSAAVDYMLLDRPIGFALEDMEEYAGSRGFVFERIRDWLPGAELFSFSDLCSFVREVGMGIDSTKEKRRRLKKIMHKYSDDQSCRRILEALRIER